MHSKTVLVFLTSVSAVFGAALPNGGGSSSQCNNGSVNCCNTLQSANTPGISALLGLLGIVVGDVTALVGIDCTSVIGVDSCTQQAACCTGNSFSGLITIGCSPINVL